MERRLPDKMPVPRNTVVVYEDTASASVSQASQKQYSVRILALLPLPNCTAHVAQPGYTRRRRATCTWLCNIQYTYRSSKEGDKPRTFAGYKEEKAYRNAVNNASRAPTREQRCALWQGGELPGENNVSQHMDLPSTDPADR
eukprot:3931157-Amphidinium_carterae.1